MSSLGWTYNMKDYIMCFSSTFLLEDVVYGVVCPGSEEKNFIWSGQCQRNFTVKSRILRGSVGSRAWRKTFSLSPEICGECPSLALGTVFPCCGGGWAASGWILNVKSNAAVSTRPAFGHHMSNAFGSASFCNEKNMLLLMDNNFWLPGLLFCFVYFSIKYSTL